MRTALLLTCVVLVATATVVAQQARTGLAITVTDPLGATLPGVVVEVLGESDRRGETNESGQIAFTGMKAGTYRLRFTGGAVIAFEKEIAVEAASGTEIDVTLHAAPLPPEPPEPPDPVSSQVGPPGLPQMFSVIDLLERELIASDEPRRDTLLACSGDTRSTLVQLNQDQAERLYDDAELTYYVVAGEGAVRVAGRDTALAAGSVVSIPRGTTYSLSRRGDRPLIVLATLSGAPCETPR